MSYYAFLYLIARFVPNLRAIVEQNGTNGQLT